MTKDNCIIYDKYFIDDLYSYKYNSKNNLISYYDNGKVIGSSNINLNNALIKIKNIIESNESDYWMPGFIASDGQPIARGAGFDTIEDWNRFSSRLLTQGAVSPYNNLGIDDAVIIEKPMFRNWDIGSKNDKNHYMSSDWILNSDLTPYMPVYGLMFWYRTAFPLENTDAGYTIFPENIPHGAIVSTNATGKLNNVDINKLLLFKITDDLYEIIENKTKIEYSENKKFRISKWKQENNTTYSPSFKIINNDPIIADKPYLSLWIPDGEMYSFFKSVGQQQEDYKKNVMSSSYLSPTLKHIYREIYHALTLKSKRSVNKIYNDSNVASIMPEPFFNRKISRAIKKIAYILASSPMAQQSNIGNFTNLLYDNDIDIASVLTSVDADTNQALGSITSLQEELKFIYYNILRISVLWQTQYEKYTPFNMSTVYNSGYVNNKSSLVQRLISKYGAKLRIKEETSLRYKSVLSNGSHVKINQDIISRTHSPYNEFQYNNIKFEVGPLIAETVIDPSSSKILLRNSLLPPDRNVSIPLWDIEKRKFANKRVEITAGDDLKIDMGDKKQDGTYDEISATLDSARATLNDPEIFGGEQLDVLWSKISGPNCLRFSNYKYSKISGQNILGSTILQGERYETSNDSNPTIYIKEPGRYVLELRVRTSFAIIYDTVVIHAISDSSDYEIEETLKMGTIQYLQPYKNISVVVPNIRECYFGKTGVFWPSYSDCSVKIPQSSPFLGTSMPPKVVLLGNNYHKFAIPMKKNKGKKIISNKNAGLRITYSPGPSTLIDISKISLHNLMDINTDCANCESIYEGIVDNKGFILDADGQTNSFDFYDPSNNNELVTVSAPDYLATNTTTKSYGGFDKKTLGTLGVSIPFHPEPGTTLPRILNTGELLSEPIVSGLNTRICHDSDISFDNTISFTKGRFDPYSGWRQDSIGVNTTHVIKFDPYHREIQTFKGPGFHELKNDFLDEQSKIYKSSIILEVDEIAYDPKEKEFIEEIDKKEMSDFIPNYGYRSIGGNVSLKDLPYNDEYDVIFPTEADIAESKDSYCNSNVDPKQYSAAYKLTRPGTLIPYSERRKANGKDGRRRWNRQGAGRIGNLEVKLNFFNYVNPKDLVVWLEIEACDRVVEALNPSNDQGKRSKGRDPWWNGSYAQAQNKITETFKSSSTGINNYLVSLFDMNDNDTAPDDSKEDSEEDSEENNKLNNKHGIYRIYLLNRDHITNLDYNINLKFSDIANLIKNPHDSNNYSYVLYNQNSIAESINNTIDLAPTLSAMGYNDIDIYKYKKIIQENKLHNYSHSFKKVINMPLFGPSPKQDKLPGNAGQTKFTLCIAVTNESDIYESYDRITATDYLAGFASNRERNKNQSNIIDNSLCNWELLLHSSEYNTGFIAGDSLGEISYDKFSLTHKKIPGYNFIADMTDKLHLLPPAVVNAPNEYMLNGQLCRYSRETLNQPTYLPTPKLEILPLLFSLPFSVIGSLVSLIEVETSMNEQVRSIVNQLNLLRIKEQSEQFNQDWYVPVYDKYPYGTNNKALVRMSKDNVVYYKAEVSIFKYSNSVIAKQKKYCVEPLGYDTKNFMLSMFAFKPIKDITILYKHLIKRIYSNAYVFPKFISTEIADQKKLLDKISGNSEEAVNERAKINKKLLELNHNLNNVGNGIQVGDIIIDLSSDSDELRSVLRVGTQKIRETTPIQNNLSLLFNNVDFITNSNMSEFVDVFSGVVSIGSAYQLIEIDGLRPYYFFKDNRQDVRVFYDVETLANNFGVNRTEQEILKEKTIRESKEEYEDQDIWFRELFFARLGWNLDSSGFDSFYIQNIGYIFDGKNYKTIIVANNQVRGEDDRPLYPGLMSISQGRRFLLSNIDDRIENNSIINNENIQSNIAFPIENKSLNIKDTVPILVDPVWKAGNYGYGTNSNNPYYLSKEYKKNQIIPISHRIDPNKTSWPLIQIDGTSISGPGYMYNVVDDKKNDIVSNFITVNAKSPSPPNSVINLVKSFNNNINTNMYQNFTNFNVIEIDLGHDMTVNDDIIEIDYDFYPTETYGYDDSIKQKIVLDNKTTAQLIDYPVDEKYPSRKQFLDKNLPKLLSDAILTKDPIQKEKLMSLYQERFQELQQINYYVSAIKQRSANTIPKIKVFPNINIKALNSLEDNFVTFNEQANNNYYWINIDPEQGCEIDLDKTPKILHSIDYKCLLYNNNITSNAKHICVPTNIPSKDPSMAGPDIYYSSDGYTTKYIIENKKIKQQIDAYNNESLKWPEPDPDTGSINANYFITRKFFLSMNGKERAQQIQATYRYIIPNIEKDVAIEPDGDIDNKILYNFNLDTTNDLNIEFIRIPRALRNKDPGFDIYEPNAEGQLTKSITPSPGGLVDTNLRLWKCLDTQTGKYVKPPDYYIWLNEMIFRLYFGSVDGVENLGKNKAITKDETYWIPYDYE